MHFILNYLNLPHFLLFLLSTLLHSFYRFKPKDASPSCNESVVWDPPLELGLATGAADATNQKVTSGQREDLVEFQPTLKLPAQLKDLKVRISHVSSPSSFFVHLTQYNNHLSRSAIKANHFKNPLNYNSDH